VYRCVRISTSGMLDAPIMKLLFCGIVLAMILCAGCYPTPDGGASWVFVTYCPVVAGGDGLSYQTAVRFKKGQAGYLATAESDWVRDKYWYPMMPKSDDSLEKFYHSTGTATENHDDRVYDIVTVSLPDGEKKTVYFDVTNYMKSSKG
jgi:hypothetical protein